MKQYENISDAYEKIAKSDPIKQFAQYPAIQLLGDLYGKRVLDVGCGTGLLSVKLLEAGAIEVVGYDQARAQIQKAMNYAQKNISFMVNNPYTFHSKIKFDIAFSNLVLPYAPTTEYLTQFFRSTFENLNPKGKFLNIILNPDYERFGKEVYNRKFEKIGREIKVHFLDKDNTTALLSDFSKKDYEEAAQAGGFQKFEWKHLSIEQKGVEKFGDIFWKDFEIDPPYIGFIVTKEK